MTIPNVNPYTGNKPTPGQPQPEFNQNMSDELDYFNSLPEELNPTIDAMNATSAQVANNAASASASAAAAEASAQSSGYAGLWPDTGGSALKGETWQTQTGGVGTGKYFTALKDTATYPVGDNDNWRSQNAAYSITTNSGLSAQDTFDVCPKNFTNLTTMLAYNSAMGELCEIKSLSATYVASSTGDGSGLQFSNGLFANVIVKNNTIRTDWFGITEGQDITAFLVSIKDKVKNENILQIQMDVNASFLGTLPFEYNRVAFSASALTGVGRLAIDTQDNVLQALPNTKSPYKVYHGKLNGMLLDNQNTKSAIEVRKEVRIVLLGDSIGVTSDWDSHGVASGDRDARGVDNFSTANALGFQIFQEICAAVGPDVRVKFYSRCVGGKSYANLGNAWDSAALNANWSGREQCTPGKAWVDCVLDLEPDLVIHEMGMNHGAFDYYNGFYDNWYLKLVGTGRVGTFDQALITTPSPNFEDAGAFGDFRPFCTPMFYVAAQQRYVANKFGMTLIDVSFNSFLKRYGIDPRTAVIAKNPVDALSSVSLTTGQTRSFRHPNNPIYSQVTFTINQDAGADLDFRINYGDGVLVQFTKTEISIYTGFFTYQTNVKTSPYAIPDNEDKTFTIQVLPHGVFVFDGDEGQTLLLSSGLTSYQNTVDPYLQNTSASGTVTITNVNVFEGEFPRYASDTSTIEMYGVLDYTQNPFGGGINHPSNHGLAEIYIPPVREFCTRLTEGEFGQYVNNQTGMVDGDLVYLGSMELLPYSVNEFYDDTSFTYLKVKVNSGGVIASIENRTGMTVWYNSRGDFYAEISGGKNVRGLHYNGNWRKHGGYVVNSANKPLRLAGFTSVAPNFSVSFEVTGNGFITRYDVATLTSGLSYGFPLDFGDNVFFEATATISGVSANPVSSPILTHLDDKVQVTSSDSGKLHYQCLFSTDANITNRRVMFKSTYLLK